MRFWKNAVKIRFWVIFGLHHFGFGSGLGQSEVEVKNKFGPGRAPNNNLLNYYAN